MSYNSNELDIKQMIIKMQEKQEQLAYELQCEREARCKLELELQSFKNIPSAVLDDVAAIKEVGEVPQSVNNVSDEAAISDPHEQAWLGYRFLCGIQCKKDREKAQHWLCLAKERVDTPPGQWAKGLCCSEGLDEQQDMDKALYWYRRSAEKGYREAQNSMGEYYYVNFFQKQREVRALMEKPWFERSAYQGCMMAQYHLGKWYEDGIITCDSIIPTPSIKIMWWQLSADQGYAPAQRDMGILLYKRLGVNDVQALNWLLLAAEQEEKEAQYYLGCIYEDKKYKEHDLNKAIKWYRLSAGQGYEKAQQRLLELAKEQKNWDPGVKIWSPKHDSFIPFFSLLQNFIGTEMVEETKAEETVNDVAYIKELAKSGDVDLQALLGYMYLYHLGGISASQQEAAYWLALAAQKTTSPAGQWAQGLSYAAGLGVAQSEQEAAQHYKRAAEEDYPPAQYSLGLCYQHGNGVSKDSKEAKRYFELAAQKGNSEAQLALHSESCLIM